MVVVLTIDDLKTNLKHQVEIYSQTKNNKTVLITFPEPKLSQLKEVEYLFFYEFLDRIYSGRYRLYDENIFIHYIFTVLEILI